MQAVWTLCEPGQPARPERRSPAPRPRRTSSSTRRRSRPAASRRSRRSAGRASATASTRERSAGIVQSATAAIAAVYESPTPIADSELCERNHGKARSRRADRRGNHERHEADSEQLAQADPRREQAGEERGQPGGQPRHRAQLSSGRGGYLEVGGKCREHRSQDEDRGLRSREAEEKRRGDRAP